ncbi:MAG TPA: hypothetical protein VHY18_08480 [Solirubrobacteraceae bacterium]|jgi:hypothetical protein|nr:hypothetical protein [Solirubrobacteraceae bacterium]
MRKIQLLGVAMVVLFAFGALTAMSASAANVYLLAEWLVGGAAVTTELLVEILGELLLEDEKGALGSPAMVLCSVILDGWVGPSSLGWISEVLSLGGVAISNTPLSGTALECTGQTACETNTTVLVWPIGYPTETEVELLEQNGIFFAVLFLKKLGYEITQCLVFGVSAEDECTAVGNGAAELTLTGASLIESFSPAISVLNEFQVANCTNGGERTGVIEGSGTFEVGGGGEVTASSETSVA